MSKLTNSMRPNASFQFKNLKDEVVRLNFFPGHFDVSEICDSTLIYANPQALKDSGYNCDQVADDYLFCETAYGAEESKYAIKVIPVSKRTRYRDFINFIKLANLKVLKMRITNLTTDNTIFGQEMEVSASAIGQKAGSDFVQLSGHRNANNYDQSFIDIDLSAKSLLLDETTLLSMDIPGNAHFQIDFTLSEE